MMHSRISNQKNNRVWAVGTGVITVLVLTPILAIAFIALQSEENIWPHLLATILPRAIKDTFLLLAGVGFLTLLIGTATAWVVTMYRFPGQRVFSWLLLLPLAMPTYITAYCYVEIFDFSGPVQVFLRGAFGWQTGRDYWFPEIRSIGGAISVISLVLYPYVYLTARSAFLAQSVCVLDVSRTLGRGAAATFVEVALPLARPALAAGVTIALMETLNDIGAVEFFGVRTLTLTIYTTWLGRGSLAGAAQLACILLVVIFLLLWVERRSRRRQRFHHTSGKYHALPRPILEGWRAWVSFVLCALPVVCGFFIPVMLLFSYGLDRWHEVDAGQYFSLAGNSLTLSFAAAIITLAVGLVLVFARRMSKSRILHAMTWFSSIGYAVPGTVLAIGVLIPLAALDNLFDGWMRDIFGVSTGLLLSGTIFALVLAYSIRFVAIPNGAIEAGLGKVSPNLALAARTLGRTQAETLREVDLPLIRPALITGALLVFVDAMKELPATLLLRPFNFETLATNVYSYASIERFEDAAFPSLTIILVGLVPVILLNRAAQLSFREKGFGREKRFDGEKQTGSASQLRQIAE